MPVASISLARPNWPHASYTRQGQLKGEIRGDCAPTIAARRQGARQRPCRSFVSIHGRQPWIRSPSRSACNWARYVATGAGGLPPSSTQSKETLGDAETGAWVTRMTLPILKAEAVPNGMASGPPRGCGKPYNRCRRRRLQRQSRGWRAVEEKSGHGGTKGRKPPGSQDSSSV